MIFLEEEILAVCPKCQKAYVQPLSSDERDFLEECGSIVDSLMFVALCEDCKIKER